MKILFDQGTPVPLRFHLIGHKIRTSYEQGWSDLKNGDLLDNAEKNGFQLLITTDQNLRYQQNLSNRKMAIIVLKSTSWPRIKSRIGIIKNTVDQIYPGDYKEVFIKKNFIYGEYG